MSGEGSSRRKIRQLADWSSHGFELISDVHGRDDSISMILSRLPSLVILDGSLPFSELCDIMEVTRSRGFEGHFFLISSKSDFKVAQAGLRYGADRYLVLPVSSAELASELKALRERIVQAHNDSEIHRTYRTLAFREVLRDVVISGNIPDKSVINALNLEADQYQVAIFDSLIPDSSASVSSFAEFVRNSGFDKVYYDSFTVSGSEIVLIKGALSISIVNELINDFHSRLRENSGFFISLGNPVSSVRDINSSYSQARYAGDRKFLASSDTFAFFYGKLIALKRDNLSNVRLDSFRRQYLDGLQTFKRHNVTDITESLRDYLVSTQAASADIKLFLSDLLLQIKGAFLNLYSTANIPFASNTEILSLISRKTFLHEVLNFYSEQFDLIMSSIGGTSRDSVLDDVFHYIRHNYSSPIKLASLATLFGYNSAYLGKIFHKAADMSFNNYIDKLRVEHSMTLLRDSDMKVYEIARQVGYKSVDYYHKKFRAITGESPAEYRKRLLSADE